MSYNPGDYGGTGEAGIVTIIPVKAILFANKVEGSVPLTVTFTTFGSIEDDDTESPTYGQMIPVVSAGTEMVLTIGDISFRTEGNIGSWNYTFREEGTHSVLLTAIGGSSIDTDGLEITANPPPPEQSANLVIRAMSITADVQEDAQIGEDYTKGDQV